MKETILKVEGLSCGGCENRIKNALGEVEGIKTVEADFHTGMVRVLAEEKVTKEEMEETITDIGFEIVKEG